MKFKAALIDLDETMCNSSQAHEEALESVVNFLLHSNREDDLNEKPHWSDKESLIDLYNESLRSVISSTPSVTAKYNRAQIFIRFVELLTGETDLQLALELYDLYYREVFMRLKLYPHSAELLKWLKDKGIKIAVVSNGSTHIRVQKIVELGLARFIDALVTSEEAGVAKPSKTPFVLALAKLDAKPSETFVIGNSEENDMFGAAELGMKSILVHRGRSLVDDSKNSRATYHVNDLAKVKDIISFSLNN